MTANKGYGFYKSTGYIFLGGDWWYTDFYGKLKDVRFYYNDALTESLIFYNMKHEN